MQRRTVFPETTRAIEQLRKKYRVVIGSTTDTAPLLLNMKRNYLTIDEIYTSELIEKYKPSPDFYKYILQREGCRASEAVFIGDSLLDDVAGPKRVGMTTVLVDRKNKYSSVEPVKPDYIVKSLDEIAGLYL